MTDNDAPTTAYDWIGGDSAVRTLVDRFYDLMDLEPEFGALRSVHPDSLDAARDKLYWFLSGWMGGPNLYIERYGHPRLRARHLPYSIGLTERDQWVACMGRAMVDVAVPEALRERLLESFLGTADWMRNRGG